MYGSFITGNHKSKMENGILWEPEDVGFTYILMAYLRCRGHFLEKVSRLKSLHEGLLITDLKKKIQKTLLIL